jgi:uncharacterized protein YcfJ
VNARDTMALGSLVLISTACVVSQPTPAAYPQGVQVRVVSTDAGPLPLEGTLIYAEADTLTLYVPQYRSTVSVPVGSVTRLEVYRGRKGSAGKAVKGAAIGTVAGAAMGAAIGATTEAIFGGMLGSQRDYGDAIAVGAADGAVAGAFVGATAGATVGDAVWQEVTVHDLRQELCHCRISRPEP